MTDMNEKVKTAADQQQQEHELKFFNYQEYLLSTNSEEEYSLVVNHFPNVYESESSLAYKQTRILRIPRIFNTVQFPDLIPQFSHYYPGSEPAAIKSNQVECKVIDGQTFNESSIVHGLGNVFPETEFEKIVKHINEMLVVAFNPYNKWTLIENILDLITGGLFLQFLNLIGVSSFTKRKLMSLEKYIEEYNSSNKEKGNDLKIISPRLTGYLSLDIQIRKP